MHNEQNKDHFDYEADALYRQQPIPPFTPIFGPGFGTPGFGPGVGVPGFGPGPGVGVPGFGPGTGVPAGPPSAPGAPTVRPPSFIPTAQHAGPSIQAVDPGAVRPCTNRFVYLWLVNGRQFWAYLVFVGPTSVAGFRWTGRRWMYFGTDLRNISSFVCY